MLSAFFSLIENREDAKAFEILYRKSYNKAFTVAMTYVRNSTIAEDVLAEAYLNIAKTYSSIADKSEELQTSYVFVAVKNCAVNTIKKENIFDIMPLDYLMSEDEPREDFFNAYDVEMIVSAIKKLESRHRAVLTCMLVYGMTGHETAKALKISRRTVFTYLTESKKILRKKLGVYD